MKNHDHVCITKLQESPHPNFKAASKDEWHCGESNLHVNKSIPVEYVVRGYLTEDVRVGIPMSAVRYERNGFASDGIILTSNIVKIKGNQVETLNSVYLVEQLDGDIKED